jgi:apolipoprotein D and lipocalin family protein
LYRLTLLAATLLAACVAKTPDMPQGAFRPKGGQVYSSAALDANRLPGRWAQVATFGPKTCQPGGVDIKPGGKAAYRLCLGGKDIKGAGHLALTGPGKLSIAGQDWWVLWVDTDYRTLVIGAPAGNFGFILNRGGAISADRLKAAREILDWNGYDLSQFTPL